MKRTIAGFPGLYRENCGVQGTRFRIVINHNKEIIQHYFYFRDPETEAATLEAAITKWREVREKCPVISKRGFREIVRHPTDSGITGVTRIISKVKDGENDFWKATWTTLRGHRKSKQFSVNKYGEADARKMAIAVRQAALDEIGEK